MSQEQVESQLSAMFDGELPAAECELLSRRIDRDENLRARWSRYALIGAAMRSEPVATARRGFASRVSAALDVSEGRQPLVSSRKKRTVWNTALAASLVATVAGISIGMLRYSTPAPRAGTLARSSGAAERALPERPTTAAPLPLAVRVVSNAGRGEPYSYKTPVNRGPVNFALRTQLADYIVAHSEYSTPLMRRSLLSTLVSSEDDADGPMPLAVATDPGHLDAAPAASSAGR